ncbi:MAG TPA: DUF5698 domain-containing protein [Humisphaera sp.]
MFDQLLPQLLPALLVFALRICDVSIGTMRMLYAIRGNRLLACVLGLLESGIFIFAISSALTGAASNKLLMVGYAAGFATGTLVGMTVENWIASGTLIARVISKHKSREVSDALRSAGFGLTEVCGHGRSMDVLVLFVVHQRKRSPQMLRVVAEADPEAFVTIESVTVARGGYVPHVAGPATVRK